MTFPDTEMQGLAAFLAHFMCVNLSPQNIEQRLNTVEDMHKFVFHIYLLTYSMWKMSVTCKLQNRWDYVAENMVALFGRLLFNTDSI